ncbi:hypothetical protein GEMRC1_013449 [Eukaryota sp. GEM-RC1]
MAVDRFIYSSQPRGLFTGDTVSLILTSGHSVEGGGSSSNRLLGSQTSSLSKASTGISSLNSMHCDSDAIHALGVPSNGEVVG